MPFLESLDSRNVKEIGQGIVATGFNRDVYFLDDTTIDNYDPADPSSDWVRVKFVEEFVANTDVGEVVIYDGKETDHTIEGRKESTISIKQQYVSFHESVEKLKNKQIFYMECIGDDRDPEDNTGKKIYSEMRIYNGKLAKFSYDKPTDGAYSVTGEGKFNTATTKIIFRDLTPVELNIGSSLTSVNATVAKTITLSAVKDIYGTDITSDLATNEEISGYKAVSETAPAGGIITVGGTITSPTLTFSVAGSYTNVKLQAITKNGFVADSNVIASVTVSA